MAVFSLLATVASLVASVSTPCFNSTTKQAQTRCHKGYDDIAYANSYGFAAVGANNGHNGTSGLPFLNAPEVVEDFAYRSVHTGVVVGKELTQSFYGSNISYSYYLGCSTGGRQGMKEAQDFPGDFDGIVAGAPAFDFNNLQSWSYWLSATAGFDNSSTDFIPRGLWTVINDEVIRQCDGLDGALDGIIEDPDLCTPKLETLLCGPEPANTSACLTPGQYARAFQTFRPLYAGPGDLLYPRLQPSAHAGAVGPLFSGAPFAYAADWAKYVVYNDADLDATKLGLQYYLDSRSLDPYNISTWSGDLSAFRDRGSKLLTYHGLSDPLISSDNSARYYAHLSATMDAPPEELDDFYWFFRICGLGHCWGGVGAWDIGQEFASRPEGVSNGGNNVLEAIVAWVERGEAPEYMEGVKWAGSNRGGSEQLRRRHCRWPYRNVYKGNGDGKDEEGWECVL
jgi:feruloyl esterase